MNASNYVCATTLENLVLAKGAAGPVLDQSARRRIGERGYVAQDLADLTAGLRGRGRGAT